jgi:methionine synthase I (cobalamin-dependent)
MNPFLEKLNAGQILVADGATGTNLQKMGLQAGIAPEDLVFDNPDLLLALAKGFVQAGSDIILTCTFGGTRLRMKESRYLDRVAEVNKRAVALARQAAEERPGVMVAGSIGPTGQMLKPYGALTPEEAREAFAEQAGALVEGGVDLLVIETMFAMPPLPTCRLWSRSVMRKRDAR